MKHSATEKLIFRGARSEVWKKGSKAVKYHLHENPCGEHEREISWLMELAYWDRVPNLRGYNHNSITMEYRGESLNAKNCPKDAGIQILEIANELRKRGICHNDITEEELLVDSKGYISLVDFEWATRASEGVPSMFPHNMGYKYRKEGKRDDLYALQQSLNSVRSIKDEMRTLPKSSQS